MFLRSALFNIRKLLVLLALALPASPSLLAQTPCANGGVAIAGVGCSYTPSERLSDYARRTYGERALLNASFGAGIQQARGAPYAWGGGTEGYTRRYAANMGKRIVSNTVQLGVEAILRQDSRYVSSERTGAGARLNDALKHSFMVRGHDGQREFAWGRIAAAVGGGLISRSWQPDGHDSVGNGFRSAGISFGGYIGSNIFREFWPNIRSHLP